MRLDDRFDVLIDSLVGFYRSWTTYVGIELGLFRLVRDAGPDGIGPADLAAAAGCAREPIEAWALMAETYGLADYDGARLRLDDELDAILLDQDRPEYLGGQIVHAVTSSLDYDGLLDFYRTGRPVTSRPDRHRRAIERLTIQDIAVFFEEALAALPDLVSDLASGLRAVDLHCGGGRWLIAVGRRFPATTLVGIEFERDSVDRARRNVAAAGLEDRIRIVEAEIPAIDASVGAFDLAYFQYALHHLADPVGSLQAGWRALAAGGRLLVLDWCAPGSLDEYRTQHGALAAGLQIDELYQGTPLLTVERTIGLFADAALPVPQVIDLPSGATLFVAVVPR